MKKKTENQKTANFKKYKIGFHGDVIVEKLDSLPEDFGSMEKVKDDCLAYGEVTGHSHQLFEGRFDLRQSKDGIRFLQVEVPTIIRHEEHNPIQLPAGNYKIGIQKEYDPWSKKIRAVTD